MIFKQFSVNILFIDALYVLGKHLGDRARNNKHIMAEGAMGAVA